MALEGKIKDFGITDILQLIGMQKKTGVLKLQKGQDTTTVTFEEGMIVSAESLQKGKGLLLGEILVQSELLSEEGLERVLSIQRERGQKLGHIFVEEKLLTSEELTSVVQLQIRETVFQIFDWTEGDYRFDQKPVQYDNMHMTPIPCESMLMEVMQMMDEWPLIRETVSSGSLVYKKTDEKRKVQPGEEDLDGEIDRMFGEIKEEDDAESSTDVLQKDFPLSLEEEHIYSLVDGIRSVQKVIQVGRLGEFKTCKALYSLASSGLIQLVGEERPVVGVEEIKEEPSKKILRNLAAYAIMLALVLSLILTSRKAGGGLFFNLAGNMTEHFRPLQSVSAVHEMSRIVHSSYLYFLEVQSFPGTLDDMIQEGFLEKEIKLDPWGTPYRLTIEARRVLLTSAGRDREEGTEDDLSLEMLF